MGPPGARLSAPVCVPLTDKTRGNTAYGFISAASLLGSVGFEAAAASPSTFIPCFASAVFPPYICWTEGSYREICSSPSPLHICPDATPAALTTITTCNRRSSKTHDEGVKGCFTAALCPCRICLELHLTNEPSGNPAAY